MHKSKVAFCAACGATTKQIIPQGDSRLRDVCTSASCGEIFYDNPKIVNGTITRFEDKILLCKRAIAPRRGYWTLPAGFMELGESCAEGAARETLEEAGAAVNILRLYAAIDVPHVSQVHLFYLADLPEPVYSAGEESLEVKLVTLSEIPWEELAFPTVKKALQWYCADLGKTEKLHEGESRWPPKKA